ncbi:MAG: DUF1592 domain-containing protein [Oligoflexales bacterium]
MKVILTLSIFLINALGCSPKKNKNPGDPSPLDRADIQPSEQEARSTQESLDGLSGTSSLRVETFNAQNANNLFLKLLTEINKPSETCKTQSYQKKKFARIITREEYIQSIQDTFQIDLQNDRKNLYTSLPVETKTLNFKHLRNSNIMSIEKLKSFMKTAEIISEKIFNKVKSDMNCGQDSNVCFKSWVQKTLPSLWRKNLTTNDIEQEISYYKQIGNDDDSIKQIIQRYLISPYFLYRTQFDQQDSKSWETATLLSDTLWRGHLDSVLMQKAQNNKLISQNDITTEIRRMMNHPQFYQGAIDWSHSWLGTDQIQTKPTMNINGNSASENQRKFLSEESGAFLYHLMKTSNDSVQNIFSANFTLLPDDLLRTYQFTNGSQELAVGIPSAFKIAKYPENRAGLLNQPSIIMNISSSSHTNIPLRGKHILSEFLCHHLETPENLVDVISAIKFDKEETTLNAVKKATSQGSCAACHSLINGPAGTLEELSPEGFQRNIDDHMKNIQIPTEVLTTLSGSRHEIRSHKELSETVGRTIDVGACMALNLFRMVHSRLETQDDICHIAQTYHQSKENGDLSLSRLYQSFLSHP